MSFQSILRINKRSGIPRRPAAKGALNIAGSRPAGIYSAGTAQKITGEKDVTVYFRVDDVYKNVKIRVTDGNTVLLSRKKARVAPGEMESVILKAEQLKNAKEVDFSLEVV